MTMAAGGKVDVRDYEPGVAIGASKWIQKAASETISGTTLQDDDDFVFSVVAGQVYEIEFLLSALSVTAIADIKTDWTVPSGSTGAKACVGPTATAASFTNRLETNGRFSFHGYATVVVYQLDTGGTAIHERSLLTAGADGQVRLRWAQNSASGTTVVEGASWAKMTRVA